MRKPNAIPGGSASPLDRSKAFKAQGRLSALQKTGSSSAKVFGTEGNVSEVTGTSIFDPVLTELIYRWFCPKEGTIFDPFAGGSVRGIVASILDRQYVGIDLREEQIAANREQADIICAERKYAPVWQTGDSLNAGDICEGLQADLIFSCPPYVDLEVYSDDPNDLSTMGYEDFSKIYRKIIQGSYSLLKENRFACFVVGEVRDKKGNYYNFVGDTVRAFIDAGFNFYNEAILITCAGSLPIRAGRPFVSARKLGKTHQNVLIFCKGDAKKATADIGDVEFGDLGVIDGA